MRTPNARRIRSRLAGSAALIALALASAGCSRHTALHAAADLVPFLDPATLVATVPLPSGGVTAYLPPDETSGSSATPHPGVALDLGSVGVPAGALDALSGFEVHLRLEVTPSVDTGPGEATLYLGPDGSPPPPDVFVQGNAVASVALPALTAGAATPVEADFAFDPAADAALFDALAAGPSRLGLALRLAGSGVAGEAEVRLSALEIAVALPAGWGLP